MSRIERVVTYTLAGGAEPIEADFAELRAVVEHDGLEVDEGSWDFEQERVEDGALGDPLGVLVDTFRTVSVSSQPKVLSL